MSALSFFGFCKIVCSEVRLLEPGKVDTGHCFEPRCMEELRRVVQETGAKLVITSSWRQLLCLLSKRQSEEKEKVVRNLESSLFFQICFFCPKVFGKSLLQH